MPAPTLRRLQQSPFRRRFQLAQPDLTYLSNRTPEQLRRHGEQFIRDRLASARPANDGRQTPMRGHPVFIAQHATATCCRKCLHKWHRIPPNQTLTEKQIQHILDLIQAWLHQRWPDQPPTEPQPSLFNPPPP